MKIKELDTKIVSIPLNETKFISTRPIKSREYLIVKLTTDSGIVGWGMAVSSFYSRAIIDGELKPFILNQDPFFVEQIWERMFNSTIRWGRRGMYLRAISALDIALWDIISKAHGQPLFKILGAYRTEIPAYASGGYYKYKKKEEEVESVYLEMKSYVERGFFAVKMKIGGVDLDTDLRRIQVAREALGDERKLFLDLNNAWKIWQISEKTMRRLEDMGVDWIEEPFMPDAIKETKKLKRITKIPIAAGELLSTRWDFLQLLENNAADIWQPDVTVLGGITEWKKIIGLASSWGIPVAPHAKHEIHAQLAASSPEVFILEYFDTTGDVVNYGKLLKKPTMVQDGYITVSEKPGTGMDFDDDLMAKYEVREV